MWILPHPGSPSLSNTAASDDLFRLTAVENVVSPATFTKPVCPRQFSSVLTCSPVVNVVFMLPENPG